MRMERGLKFQTMARYGVLTTLVPIGLPIAMAAGFMSRTGDGPGSRTIPGDGLRITMAAG
jgi:hypothetical protein